MKRTTKGRVVYHRKPHLFHVSDVVRIMKDVLVNYRAKGITFNTEFNQEWVEMMAALLFIFSIEKGLVASLPSIRYFLQNSVNLVDQGFYVYDVYKDFLGGIYA